MTRPRVRPTARKRCNLALGLHRLDCTGHETSKARRLTRSAAQKQRRERERSESLARAGRVGAERRWGTPGDKRLRSPLSVNSGLGGSYDQKGQNRHAIEAGQAPLMSPRRTSRVTDENLCLVCQQEHIDFDRPDGTGYCHRYRTRGEHYHESYAELLACPN